MRFIPLIVIANSSAAWAQVCPTVAYGTDNAPLFDSKGHLWDISTNGVINNGSSTFDGGFYLSVDGVPYDPNASTLQGTEWTTAPMPLSGLLVSRRIFVSPTAPIARWLNVFENPTAEDITVDVFIGSNLDSDNIAQVGNSSQIPFSAFTPGDTWVRTGVVVLAVGDGTALMPYSVGLADPGGTNCLGFPDGLDTFYTLTVPAETTATILQLVGQSGQITGRVDLSPEARVGMTQTDLAQVVNFSAATLPEAMDAMVDFANTSWGSDVVVETSNRARLRPSSWDARAEALWAQLEGAGCTTPTQEVFGAGGRYNAGPARTVEGLWSGGVVDGVLLTGNQYNATFQGVGAVGAVYSGHRNSKHLADFGSDGAAPGEFVRVAGRRGVFWSLPVACEAGGHPADALDAWYPPSLDDWPRD